jgi:hypothetical protein
MKIITPPNEIDWDDADISIFLAGTIDNGAGVDWQKQFIEEIREFEEATPRPLNKHNVVLLNPRRDNWVSTVTQRKSDPMFREQVEWELDAQEKCSLIIMYFAPKSKSPITLMELGLFAGIKNVIVGCPDDFWRKGNVEMVCERADVPLVSSLDFLIFSTKMYLMGALSC